MTLTDEGTVDAGVAKRRQQKIYSDVLGRTVKTEVLNWQGGSVYSATVNTYNVRDQVTQIRQYAGAAGSGTFQDTTMNYDGYGRLKSRHVPEQNVGTATIWNYNPDDTIQMITDARGASQTFTYNQRHLTTNITYSAPGGSGISVPAAVSFVYDGAGNRTAMTDGSGTTSYSYDQLSRLTSEARTFAGLSGTFTLSYGYNFANQLISLAEPTQFGSTFSYVYDASGRITHVNGSAFAGVTNYASNTQYRAWGGLKHINYGNSRALDVTYNSRLQAATFNIPGVISKSYDYYADGALRFSDDLTNNKWDRFYSHDHASRIKEAFSGAEARFEPQTTNRPYRQTFSYDGFGHITERVSLNWAATYNSSAAYANNRRNSWSYDADGNLLSGADTTYNHDAGGRIRTVGTFEPLGTTTRSLDGDGRQVKTENVSYDESTESWVTTICYYLRSSLLNGEVLTEIASTGAKKRTFVYAGDKALAWHVYYGPNPGVVWEHRDASGASFRTSDKFGQAVGHSPDEDPAELDPVGADAGLHAPLNPPSEPQEGNGSLVPYPSFSNPAQPDLKYGVDHIPVPVDYFRLQLDLSFHGSLGLAEAASRATARVTGGRNAGVHWGTPFEVVYDANGNVVSERWGDFNPALRNTNFGNETLMYGGWNLAFTFFPQKPGPQQPNQTVIAIVNAVFANPGCADFLKTILNKASTGGNPVLEGGEIAKIFSDFLAQKGGGVIRGSLPGARYGSASGRIQSAGKGNGVIYRGTVASPGNQDEYDASGIVNELPHLAGSNGGWPKRNEYDDLSLARAAYDSGYDKYFRFFTVPNPFSTYPDKKSQERNRFSNVWSSYFHDILKQHCPLP